MLTLSQLVAQVESGNEFSAVRYEPGWKYVTAENLRRFHRAHAPLKMNNETSRMLLSCSWGKYQMMGSNLYDLGFESPLVVFAASEYLQGAWFEMFLKARKIDFTLDEILTDKNKREFFSLKYNGDKKVYAERLLNVYEHMKGK